MAVRRSKAATRSLLCRPNEGLGRSVGPVDLSRQPPPPMLAPITTTGNGLKPDHEGGNTHRDTFRS